MIFRAELSLILVDFLLKRNLNKLISFFLYISKICQSIKPRNSKKELNFLKNISISNLPPDRLQIRCHFLILLDFHAWSRPNSKKHFIKCLIFQTEFIDLPTYFHHESSPGKIKIYLCID